jgi:hypothetical protein
MKKNIIKKLFLVFFITFFCNIGFAQVSTYTFIDPCTKIVTNFSVPLQGGKTMIIFLDNVGYFDANDMSNGTFTNWVNQSYKVYRQTNPCSQQQGQVTQNQITTQLISGTVQSLVGSILSSNQSQSSNTESSSVTNGDGGSDAGGKDNKSSEKKKNKSNGTGNSQGSDGNGSSTQNNGQSGSSSGNNTQQGGNNTQQGGNNTQQGGSTSTNNPTSGNSNNTTTGGGSSTQPPVGSQGGGSTSGNSGNNGGTSNSGSTGGSGSTSGNNGGTSTGNNTTKPSTEQNGSGSTNDNSTKQEKGNEVGATITMNTDAHNDKGEGGGSSGGKGNARSNPLIISSDITSAQNLNGTFTPIVNISTNKSSMTGLSSYGVTGMVWLNFRQFAVSTKYTKIHYNKTKKLKFIHNLNLTGVYTYGNYLGFVGYSGILNGGKYGITGFNISAAATVISQEKSGYYSPSITGFYTRPFKVGKKLVVSPELYVISTPLVYSTKEKVSITDRYISGFIGSGFDYQLSKRFKINLNYKANMSTNPDFPILSFFLIGSKVNL